MEARAQFLIVYAKCDAPVTVRRLFYAATIRGLIHKTEGGYNKVQAQVLALRRDGRLSLHTGNVSSEPNAKP